MILLIAVIPFEVKSSKKRIRERLSEGGTTDIVVMPSTAHHLTGEKLDEFNRIVLEFLKDMQ